MNTHVLVSTECLYLLLFIDMCVEYNLLLILRLKSQKNWRQKKRLWLRPRASGPHRCPVRECPHAVAAATMTDPNSRASCASWKKVVAGWLDFFYYFFPEIQNEHVVDHHWWDAWRDTCGFLIRTCIGILNYPSNLLLEHIFCDGKSGTLQKKKKKLGMYWNACM